MNEASKPGGAQGSGIQQYTGRPISRRKALSGLASLGGTGLVYGTGTRTASAASATNIVLLVGDGMGPNQIKSGRGLKAARAGRSGSTEPLQLDRHTYSGESTTTNESGGITDSAAAGTAISTGFKTRNGVIGGIIDSSGRFVPKETVLERAKKAGYKTGLVSTSTITDATPAAFGAHVADRSKQAEIARQYIEATGVDVLLGGGRRYFSSTLRDKAKSAGYTYVDTASKLSNLSGSGRTLGLFASRSLNSAVTRFNSSTTQPNMDLMIRKAMQRLGSGKSFLVVENEHIDTNAHSNDPAFTHDVLELDESGTRIALDSRGSETLVITTADHETGGLSFTSSPNFRVINDLKATGNTLRKRIASADGDETQIRAIVADGTGITDLTVLEMESLKANSGNIRKIVSNRAGYRWSTTKHTKTAVPRFATGPGASSLQGQSHLTGLSDVMRSVIS